VVSSEYGSLSDLTTLVTEAHSRGMYVLMDWVGNHTAWDHPWITTHPDWYSQNGQGEIIHPPGTNWQDVADLNYDSAAVLPNNLATFFVEIENGFHFSHSDGALLW